MFMCVFAHAHDFISERLMISEMLTIWRLEIFLKAKRERKKEKREREERGTLAAVTKAEDAFQQERQVVWDDVHEESRHVWHGVVVAEHVVLDAVGGFRGV